MDAGLAALLGASIGGFATFLAGFLGPWVRDVFERRARSKEARSTALREQIVLVVEALGRLLRAKQAGDSGAYTSLHTDAAVAITRFAVLLDSEDAQVESLLGMVLNSIAQLTTPVAAIALTEAQQILHIWIRGDITGSKVVEDYKARMGVREEAAKADH